MSDAVAQRAALVTGASRRLGAATVGALARGAVAVTLAARIVAGCGRAPGGAVG